MKQFCSLSEAIRAGVTLRPQCRGLFEKTRAGYIGSCALGSAYEAMTGRIETEAEKRDIAYRTLEDAFPYMLGGRMVCPARGCGAVNSLESSILHLNDDHKWTRERIADFVEEYEEKIGFVHVVESEQERSSSQVVAVGV